MKTAFLLTLLPVSLAFGWGEEGHRAIWEVAQSRLTPAAKSKVATILAGDKLDMTAMWLDKVREIGKGKGGELAADADAQAFNAKFPFNATWHYVNQPLGAANYAAAAKFHGIDDVVKQLVVCMKILSGKSADMDQRTALRVLVHLVGDIHQPLHCGNGFFDISDMAHPVLKTDPADCAALHKQKCTDQGGNLLFFGPEKFDQLHSFWDTDAVKRVMMLADLKDILIKHAPNVSPATSGTVEEWPEQWATESMHLAAKAYEGLTFGACSPPQFPGAKGPIGRIEVTLPAGYADFSKKIAADQLTKASIRLAYVLNGLLK